jgi:hypothetical protein
MHMRAVRAARPVSRNPDSSARGLVDDSGGGATPFAPHETLVALVGLDEFSLAGQ